VAREDIFVGRKQELARFKEVLADPAGQAVVVVGQAGMGKTWLINKMAKIATNDGQLKCGWVRYEVTPTDTVDSTMALMIDNAFEAGQVEEGSFDGTPGRLEQWRAFLNVFNIGDLVMSLRRDPQRNTRDQFIERLRLISKCMSDKGRAIFVIDPEKYMQPDSEQSWALVVKDLPDRIKLVFAQRTEDVLVESETFGRLRNVVYIPENWLGELGEGEVEELLDLRAGEVGASEKELREALADYKGHPFAIQAALDLVKAGTKPAQLPQDPSGIAQAQWKKLSSIDKDAIRLFKAYAIWEVGVPGEVVEVVSGLDPDTHQHLLADKYLSGLLRDEADGRRIYHAILADYIVGQIGEDEKTKYHARAVDIYRKRLKADVKPDALTAVRLAEHVLKAEGKEAFVEVFINECTPPLLNLGLLDAAISLSERALEMVEDESEEKAALSGNLGLIYRKRGELDKAEEMHKKSLAIEKKLGRLEGMANQYGNLGNIYYKRGELDKAEEMFLRVLKIEDKLGRPDSRANAYGNLGLIYRTRGDLDKAEEMHKKSLAIEEKLGRLEGMASDYGNLGLIYRTRGELDKAEEMLNKALEIDKKLGRLEGMASDYGNLGVIEQTRGELDKAEKMHNKALELNEKLGRLEGMASQYGNLGLIYQTRGDLDKAEEMHKKSLAIEEKLGRLEGMANQYGNLGAVYEERGDKKRAGEFWEQSRDLYEKIGMPHMVKKVQGWIDGLK
jgi:tetratricopeptide (TPR) repeat protein